MADQHPKPLGDEPVSIALEGAPLVAYRVIRSFLRAIAKTYFRLDVRGMEHLPTVGGYVLAPGGHRSILDTPAVSLAGPRVLRYMGAENYFAIPVLGWFLRAMGGFPVERSTTDRNALRLAEWVLRNGEPLAVFPESTRQEGPTIEDLKEGAAFLACRAQVPIVPVGIGGAERAMPKGAKWIRPRKV
ncbi:MAG: lysophospholipid acyltransferase family protein, partial [Acidimicrobiales bacterium]